MTVAWLISAEPHTVHVPPWSTAESMKPTAKEKPPQPLQTTIRITHVANLHMWAMLHVTRCQDTHALWFLLQQDYREGITKAIGQKTTKLQPLCYMCSDKMNSSTFLFTKQSQSHVHTPLIIQLLGHLTENKAKGLRPEYSKMVYFKGLPSI